MRKIKNIDSGRRDKYQESHITHMLNISHKRLRFDIDTFIEGFVV